MMNAHDEVDDRLRQAGVNDDAAVAATKDDEDDTSISVVGNEINNDDDGDENNERLLQEEEDEEQRAAIAAARLRHQQRPEKQRRKLSKVLEQAENFPVRQRMKINQLVDYFLSKLEEDIYRMVTDQRIIDYRGLDSERDTEAEVETALRIFPHTLRRRKRDESGNNLTLYPIHCLSLKTDGTDDNIDNYYGRNIESASFIHLFARLAIELKSFEENERGGLLIRVTESNQYSKNILGWLASSPQPNADKDINDHIQHGDEVCLLEMIQLRKMNLMKKEDIPQFRLIEIPNFYPRRLRFLVEWCPQSLPHVHTWGHVSLHFVAADTSRSIQDFQTLFDYCIRYYPKMKGINLLFQQDNAEMTPYHYAIQKFGRKKVMNVVEEVLTRYANTTPIQTEEAVILAATDDRVHLDSVYFLLRRDPKVLCGSRLLLPTVEVANDGDDNDDVASEHTIIRNNMANDGTNKNKNIGADDNGSNENNINRNTVKSDLYLNVDDDNGSSSSIDDDVNGDHPANGRNRKRQRIK